MTCSGSSNYTLLPDVSFSAEPCTQMIRTQMIRALKEAMDIKPVENQIACVADLITLIKRFNAFASLPNERISAGLCVDRQIDKGPVERNKLP